MANDFAKFMATTDKKIVFGDKDVELKLTIPHKVAQQNLQFLTGCLNKEIHVILGDPQAAFDFDVDGRDDMYHKWDGGRRVTTDASGVVTRIEGNGEEERDDNQAELFDQEGNAQEPDGDGKKTNNDDGQSDVPPTDGDDDPGTDPNDPYGDNDDIPDWMKDDSQGQSEPKEMDFASQRTEGDPEGASGEIDKDALEQYIITERPTFPDMPLDFPDLFEQKRDQGVTWREIANSVGLTSGQFSSKLTKYKERVKEAMAGSGVA